MNKVTRDIMKLLKCDANVAAAVQCIMEAGSLDFSQCTQREFNQAARAASMQLDAEASRSGPKGFVSRDATFRNSGRRIDTPASVKPTRSWVEYVKVKGDVVEFEQGGVIASLKCNGSMHAELIAKALSDGLVSFDTRCE